MVWRTRRRRRGDDGALAFQPLNYDAWRAVLRRANARLGTNWSMHDLRRTCAIRMVRDQNLSLRDIQIVLGHAHPTTTELYLIEADQQVISRVHQHHTAQTPRPATPIKAAAGYDPAADLTILFGQELR